MSRLEKPCYWLVEPQEYHPPFAHLSAALEGAGSPWCPPAFPFLVPRPGHSRTLLPLTVLVTSVSTLSKHDKRRTSWAEQFLLRVSSLAALTYLLLAVGGHGKYEESMERKNGVINRGNLRKVKIIC